MRKILCVAVLVVDLLGCSRHRPPLSMPFQRFLPISPSPQMVQNSVWHGFFALDTQTGQLCRTTKLDLAMPDFNALPTCLSLVQEPVR
jgi:hypothetical protein